MKEGGRGVERQRRRARVCATCLIVTEVALAFVLLVGSGLMMRSFFRLLNVDTGPRFDQRADHRVADHDRALPGSGAIEPVSARDPHRCRSRAGRARDAR